MGFIYWSAALVMVTLIAIVVIRSRTVATKLACEAALLLGIAAYLMARGTTPLLDAAPVSHGTDGGWVRALAFIWWVIGARFVATITVMALGHDAQSRQARLFSDLAAGAIYLAAALIILNSVLDLPVKGLLATSGVIAIVLGLALQNTLADVFSGIAVGLEQPFHVGDRITIAEHAEGKVVEMNWRSIRIETDGEDIATIPNSIVAKSQIVNRSVPTEQRAASIEIPTLSTFRSDRLIDLVREAILLCPAVLDHPAPSVTIKLLGVRKTVIGVTYFVANTRGLSTARSELLRQVRRLFRYADVLAEGTLTPERLLAELILFESLTTEQIAALAQALVRRRLDISDTIFEQGSEGASLFIVRAGIYEISRAEQAGHRHVFGRIGPGEYIGELSMMTGDPRPVTVQALSPGEVWELPRGAVESLLGADTALSVALERSVKRGLALLDRDAAARTCQPLDDAGTLLGRLRNFLHLPRT